MPKKASDRTKSSELEQISHKTYLGFPSRSVAKAGKRLRDKAQVLKTKAYATYNSAAQELIFYQLLWYLETLHHSSKFDYAKAEKLIAGLEKGEHVSHTILYLNGRLYENGPYTALDILIMRCWSSEENTQIPEKIKLVELLLEKYKKPINYVKILRLDLLMKHRPEMAEHFIKKYKIRFGAKEHNFSYNLRMLQALLGHIVNQTYPNPQAMFELFNYLVERGIYVKDISYTIHKDGTKTEKEYVPNEPTLLDRVFKIRDNYLTAGGTEADNNYPANSPLPKIYLEIAKILICRGVVHNPTLVEKTNNIPGIIRLYGSIARKINNMAGRDQGISEEYKEWGGRLPIDAYGLIAHLITPRVLQYNKTLAESTSALHHHSRRKINEFLYGDIIATVFPGLQKADIEAISELVKHKISKMDPAIGKAILKKYSEIDRKMVDLMFAKIAGPLRKANILTAVSGKEYKDVFRELFVEMDPETITNSALLNKIDEVMAKYLGASSALIAKYKDANISAAEFKEIAREIMLQAQKELVSTKRATPSAS